MDAEEALEAELEGVGGEISLFDYSIYLSRGLRAEPCGTPLVVGSDSDRLPSILLGVIETKFHAHVLVDSLDGVRSTGGHRRTLSLKSPGEKCE